MNAYTLPLNAPEKRHSEFFGEFKDLVNTLLDVFGPVFVDWSILTSRQVVRMADAEFIAALALAIEEGIVSTSPAKLLAVYRSNDVNFPKRDVLNMRISEVFNIVLTELSVLQGTYMKKPHVFHSLLCALPHNQYGLVGTENFKSPCR